MERTYSILSPLVVLNLLTHQTSQKLYLNILKKLHRLEVFEISTMSLSNLSSFLSETGTYSMKINNGQDIQLLLNRYRVLIYEFHKNCVGNTKIEKSYFLLFWCNCGNSFLQNCVYLRKQLYWRTNLFVVERFQQFD